MTTVAEGFLNANNLKKPYVFLKTDGKSQLSESSEGAGNPYDQTPYFRDVVYGTFENVTEYVGQDYINTSVPGLPEDWRGNSIFLSSKKINSIIPDSFDCETSLQAETFVAKIYNQNQITRYLFSETELTKLLGSGTVRINVKLEEYQDTVGEATDLDTETNCTLSEVEKERIKLKGINEPDAVILDIVLIKK